MIGKLDYKRFLLLATLPAFMLASCSQEETPGEPGSNPDAQSGEIRFEIGFAPTNGAIVASPQTRVATSTDGLFKCTWEDGDEIGIFAYKSKDDLYKNNNPYINNVKMTYRDGKWTTESPLYWPVSSGEQLFFMAKFPYDADFKLAKFTYSVETDQNAVIDGKSNFNRSYFLLTPTNEADLQPWVKGNKVSLEFSYHYLSLVHLTLENVNPDKEVSVTLRNCGTETSAELIDKILHFGSGDIRRDIKMQRVEQPGDADYRTSFTFRALIPGDINWENGKSYFRIANGDLLFNSSKLTEDFIIRLGEAHLFTQQLPTYNSSEQVIARFKAYFYQDGKVYANQLGSFQPSEWALATDDARKPLDIFTEITGVPVSMKSQYEYSYQSSDGKCNINIRGSAKADTEAVFATFHVSISENKDIETMHIVTIDYFKGDNSDDIVTEVPVIYA